MSEGTFTTCPLCGQRVEPNADGVVYAVEQVDVPGFGQAHDFVDGRGGFFHPGCPPERIDWQRRQRSEGT